MYLSVFPRRGRFFGAGRPRTALTFAFAGLSSLPPIYICIYIHLRTTSVLLPYYFRTTSVLLPYYSRTSPVLLPYYFRTAHARGSRMEVGRKSDGSRTEVGQKSDGSRMEVGRRPAAGRPAVWPPGKSSQTTKNTKRHFSPISTGDLVALEIPMNRSFLR